MTEVTAKKAELLGIIRANRETHRDIVAQAREKFRLAAIEELEARLASIRDGGEVDLMFGLSEPPDHTADYDRVIRMLEMEVKEEVTLDQNEFSCFVLDVWTWTRGWSAVTSAYVSHAKLGNA